MIEFAIVICIIGLLLGGIWVYAGYVGERANQQKAVDELNMVVSNTRAYYAGRAGIPKYGVEEITSELLKASAIPPYMARPVAGCTAIAGDLCADGPWGSLSAGARDAQGTLGVCDWLAGGNPLMSCVQTVSPLPAAAYTQFFAVTFRGLSQASCTGLATQGSGPLSPQGLIQITISGCDAGAAAAVVEKPPVPAKNAVADCACASGDNSAIVNFVYRLNPGNF